MQILHDIRFEVLTACLVPMHKYPWKVCLCACARARFKAKVRELKGTHFESGKRERERRMQTGHAMTKEERMFRATENSSVRSRRENQRRKQKF